MRKLTRSVSVTARTGAITSAVLLCVLGLAGCASHQASVKPKKTTFSVPVTFTIPANDQGESTCTPLTTTEVGDLSTIFFSGPGVPGKFHLDVMSLPTPAYNSDQSQCVYHLTVHNVRPVKGTYNVMFPGVGASRGEYTLAQVRSGVSGMIP